MSEWVSISLSLLAIYIAGMNVGYVLGASKALRKKGMF